MKKVIKGKLYDTEKAEELASAENSERPSDINYVQETLYKKRTGEFFILGYGGSNTRYAKHEDERWTAGQLIQPLSYEQAQAWAEKNLSGDEYESIFGEVEEDGSNVTMTISIPASIKAKIERMASKEGLTQSAIIARLVDEAE